jgi:spermidine/putrescine-binding protein
MEKQAGIKIKWTVKSADAQESLQKMLVGGGQKLYDAFTDNGGGMEDAMAETKNIVPLDSSRLKNWKLLSDSVRTPGGQAAHTIRYKGRVYAVPYISNADSMAYLPEELGFVPDSWAYLFDRQFKGRVAMQNDFGPTLTNTAIYLKQSGKVDIADASNMTPKEVKAVCQFLIGHKKAGQFRTFWTGFGDSVNLLVQKEVVMMSCWEPQVYVSRRKGVHVEYANMKEGHQVWNNVVMLSKGGKQRGKEDAFYRLCDAFLSHWYTSKQLARLGFASNTDGVLDYIKANPKGFDLKHLTTVLENKAIRYANPGNAWQNVYPKHLEAYQEWWSRVQAA